jgi:hypothetical protein
MKLVNEQEHLAIIKEVIQLAFSSGKISNIDMIKRITESFDIITNIVEFHFEKNKIEKK